MAASHSLRRDVGMASVVMLLKRVIVKDWAFLFYDDTLLPMTRLQQFVTLRPLY
jgi:hypothetical protein